jgi:hypothetical protein
MAVRVGFEPTEPVKVQRFSRPPDSTALAPHRSAVFLLIVPKPPSKLRDVMLDIPTKCLFPRPTPPAFSTRLVFPYQLREYSVGEDLGATHVADAIGLPAQQICKTLVARGDCTGVLLACIPGNAELDLKALAAVSGNKKLELVPVREILGITGFIVEDVPRWALAKLIRFTWISASNLGPGLDQRIEFTSNNAVDL